MKDIRVKIKFKNNLILQRAEELWGKGISQKEIADHCGMSQQIMGKYLNFKESPLTKRKKWNLIANKIASSLKCLPEDIFPEHLIEIRNSEFEVEMDFQQVYFLINEVETPEQIMMNKEGFENIEKILKRLSSREEKVLRLRFFEDCTLEEIGKQFGVSGERIREIEYGALDKLRHPKNNLSLLV